MKVLQEQRVCVKFCYKLGKTCAETFKLLKEVYGDETMSSTQVYEWYGRFKKGLMSIEDEPKPGRPSTSVNDETEKQISILLAEDRRRSLRELSEIVQISFGSCQAIVENLGYTKVASKFVPRILTRDQKENRLAICKELLQRANTDENFLKNVITGDETWVYAYDVETKQQSSQWVRKGEPRPKKARMSRSDQKIMLIAFFDHQGVVHHEYVPQGVTVNAEYYEGVLRRLREDVRRKRPALWQRKNWLLHHDNARPHTALRIREFLARNNLPIVPQPPYSPDLSPADFFLFPRMKLRLKGQRFATRETIISESQKVLRSIPSAAFSACFADWKKRFQRCIDAQGSYFEGDPH